MKVGNASLRGARELLLSATAPCAARGADPAHRARRARDHARLLRALRRRVPVQAAAATSSPQGERDDDRTRAPVHRHRRERAHDPRPATARPASSATRTARRALRFTDRHGQARLLPIPPEEEQRRRTTRRAASSTCAPPSASRARDGPDAADGHRLPARARRAPGRGRRAFLDVNVDEYSHRPHEQIEAMRWLVELLAPAVARPALDRLLEPRHHPRGHGGRGGARRSRRCSTPPRSSAPTRSSWPPRRAAPVIVTAAGATGMPSNAEERVGERERRWSTRALALGIPIDPHLRRPARLPDLRRRQVRPPLPRRDPRAARALRARAAHHGRHEQRLVRHPRAAADQRRVPRARGGGRRRQRHHRPDREQRRRRAGPRSRDARRSSSRTPC